ncbi:MAG: SIS domain-containing protein [Gammaproteobacteria bacterium]|nr:SIS domain-containing protein [Gammaproteobacteria bacterium]MBT5205081.1 SIS domain-containing protein [Gammaproteobacteria bacterium]MBT5603957.1 SIS domain-containing protein [Gammaproteobacteria bacterium]MBT6244035.1 SIS domain-containing protein [Gammaproteobacteria bacterium]
MDIKQKLTRVINSEAAAISRIQVTDQFEKAVQLLNACAGKVVATGIGKAGFIARKFAATLASTGTPAIYIHPAEAGHGDLGMLAENDCIVAFSTSGKSNEVIEMLEMARQLGVTEIIGLTSHAESPLRNLSQLVLDMGPDIEEPCPLGLTPSATIAVMLAISDAIALTLMELKEFRREDYGKRHHKGYLGTISRQKYNRQSD